MSCRINCHLLRLSGLWVTHSPLLCVYGVHELMRACVAARRGQVTLTPDAYESLAAEPFVSHLRALDVSSEGIVAPLVGGGLEQQEPQRPRSTAQRPAYLPGLHCPAQQPQTLPALIPFSSSCSAR